jgi:hypothetical protein
MALLSPDRVAGYDRSSEHLRDELHRIAGFVRAQLWRYRNAVPETQRERFWHLPDDQLDAISQDNDQSPLQAFDDSDAVRGIVGWTKARRDAIDERKGRTRVDLRFVRLANEFHVASPLAMDGLLLALLPSLHSRYRRWYGILQHDPAKSMATVGLLVEMLAQSGDGYGAVVKNLAPDGPLGRSRVLIYGGADDEPLALRCVSVDDRVIAFLFPEEDGQERAPRLDPRIDHAARWFDEAIDVRALPVAAETINRLEMLPNLRAADPSVFKRLRLQFLGPDGGLAVRAFGAVAAGLGQRVLAIDVGALLATSVPWPVSVDCVLRDARLGQAWPLFSNVSGLYEQTDANSRLDQLLSRLSAFTCPAAMHLDSPAGEEARALAEWIPFRLPAPTIAMREKLWANLLGTIASRVRDRDTTARDLANAFQLTDSQVRDSWRTAEGFARRRNVFMASIERDDLYAACRQQSARRLVAFATRIEPRGTLTLDRDLILAPASKQALLELRARIRNHARVHGAMALGDHMRLGRGVTACFIGGSGVGKTMAAEVLASEHQIDLYRVDLAALVSKWVGETEKNLSRILADAERANCMLFFDEADAIFGQRGEIKEARDRWANLEVNYLLQRIEEYSGVVILATNLHQNIDEAFHRRMHVIVPFPPPTAALRYEIWQRLLPGGERRDVSDDELRELSDRFELTGGNIRNVVLDACFRAVDRGDAALTLRLLVAGTAREYQKISRPVTRGDFGRFYQWAMEDVIAPGGAAVPAGA